MDEGSPGYAMAFYCLYYLKLRAVVCRDIYHRQWNDCSGALKEAGLWWVVLLCMVPFCLPVGPWGGGA
eukprot:11130186-Lingulodinium_polyedra.AAC.1